MPRELKLMIHSFCFRFKKQCISKLRTVTLVIEGIAVLYPLEASFPPEEEIGLM